MYFIFISLKDIAYADATTSMASCYHQQISTITYRIRNHCLLIVSLDVDETNPRPVHDRVPHLIRHHLGSSPDDARLVHEWNHRSTSGTHLACLRHVYFHALKIDVYQTWTIFYRHIRSWCDIPCHIRSGWRLQKILSTGRGPFSGCVPFTCQKNLRTRTCGVV
jgi:hypothetical protein